MAFKMKGSPYPWRTRAERIADRAEKRENRRKNRRKKKQAKIVEDINDPEKAGTGRTIGYNPITGKFSQE